MKLNDTKCKNAKPLDALKKLALQGDVKAQELYKKQRKSLGYSAEIEEIRFNCLPQSMNVFLKQ